MGKDTILERINEAGLKFLLPLTPDEAYRIIVQEAVKLVDAEYGSIILLVDGALERVYSSSEEGIKTVNRTNGNTQNAFNSRQVIVAQITETSKFHPELKAYGIKSTIFIPLSYEDKAIGVLTINAKKKLKETALELRVLKLFGSMATLAIRKSQMYDETKQALNIRDMFISLASHELRTPLTSINGYIQLLHSRMGKQETSEAKWVRELHEESKRLTNLVTELLEINRIKQGQLQFILREAHFSEIVQNAINECQLKFIDRNISFTNELSETEDLVIGDADKLKRVVKALIENALKFSPSDSVVTVSLNTQNQHLSLKVSDRGSGIAREDMIRVFEGFYKGPDNHQEGMGVGLLLAKHIINYHHGTIGVTSEVKRGTTVSVTLPQVVV